MQWGEKNDLQRLRGESWEKTSEINCGLVGCVGNVIKMQSSLKNYVVK